jgi:hypothetical protein
MSRAMPTDPDDILKRMDGCMFKIWEIKEARADNDDPVYQSQLDEAESLYANSLAEWCGCWRKYVRRVETAKQ